MNKENVLFGIVGLLLGLIVGFMFANSVNQNGATRAATAPGIKQSSTLPQGHPDVPENSSSSSKPTVSASEIQAAVDKAKQNPTDFEAQMSAAEVYYQNEKYDGAIEFLTIANKLKPDNYEVIVNLGNTNFDSNHYEEADKWYSAALTKKAEDVNVRTDLGLTFIFRAPPNYDRAIQEFTKVLEKDPNHIQALQNMTVAYTKKNDAVKAKETLARLESVDPTNSSIAKLREEIQKASVK